MIKYIRIIVWRGLGLCDITHPKVDGWVDLYYYSVVVYTHCQDTFQFKQHVKVNFAFDDPFNAG